MDTSNNNQLTFFETIYGIGQYGKYVNPDVGATRLNVAIKSSHGNCLTGTSFKNNDSDQKLIVVVNNFCNTDIDIGMQRGSEYVEATIPNGITTFLW